MHHVAERTGSNNSETSHPLHPNRLTGTTEKYTLDKIIQESQTSIKILSMNKTSRDPGSSMDVGAPALVGGPLVIDEEQLQADHNTMEVSPEAGKVTIESHERRE